MVNPVLFLTAFIAGAFLFVLAVLAILGRIGTERRALKAFVQASRWIAAGLMVGAVVATYQDFGGIATLVIALISIGGLTIAEYIFLVQEEQAEESKAEA